MALQFATSGAVPGNNVAIRTQGGVLWFGTVQVMGAGSRGQSGVEWIIFASQPLAVSSFVTNSGQVLLNPSVPSRIRYAAILAGTYTNGSATVWADIASGGIPDVMNPTIATSGNNAAGRASVSGVVVAGVLQGPAVGIQWYIQGSGYVVGSGLATNYTAMFSPTSSFVSGNNLGLLLIGDV